MTLTQRDALRALVADSPADAMLSIPARWVVELLSDRDGTSDGATSAPPTVAVDLTVAEAGKRLNRKPSTLRAWCIAGELPGAYRSHGREWRIPPAAIEAMQHAQAKQHTAASCRRSRRPTTDIGAWREHMPRASA